MDWLLLGGLGIIWTASLFPTWRRRASARTSMRDFERGMDVLAETDRTDRIGGRWIIAPRKGERFIGERERARARARMRRRQVFVFLLEAIGVTFLIGMVPPLRAMWVASGLLVIGLGLYCWFLIGIKQSEVRGEPASDEWSYAPPPPAANGYALSPVSASLRRAEGRAEGRLSLVRANGDSAGHPLAAVAGGGIQNPRLRIHPGRVTLDDGDVTHVIVRSAHEVKAAI